MQLESQVTIPCAKIDLSNSEGYDKTESTAIFNAKWSKKIFNFPISITAAVESVYKVGYMRI